MTEIEQAALYSALSKLRTVEQVGTRQEQFAIFEMRALLHAMRALRAGRMPFSVLPAETKEVVRALDDLGV